MEEFKVQSPTPLSSWQPALILSITAVLLGGSWQLGFGIGSMANTIPIISTRFGLDSILISLIVSGNPIAQYVPLGSGSPYRFLLSISAVLLGGSFQFGYALSCVANTIPIVAREFALTPLIVSLFVSGNQIGGLFGAVIGGPAADRYGRKRVMMLNSIPMVIGTFLIVLAQSQYHLIFGRVISGFAVGVGSALTPMYLQEISTVGARGAVGTCHGVTLTTGILLGYVFSIPALIGTAETSGNRWRVFMGLPFIPALYQTLALMWCPESPHWLYHRGEVEAATAELRRLRGRTDVEGEIDAMSGEKVEGKVTFADVIADPVSRLALFIGIGLHGSQQLSGINVVLSYAPQIFSQASVDNPAMPTVITGCVNVLAALSTVILVDRLGRRPLLIGGLVLMTLAYLGVGVAQTCHVIGSCGGSWTGYFSIFMVCLFIIGFGSTLGNIPWFMVGELASIQNRGTINSICVACNWIFNLLIVFTYDTINNAIRPYTFFLYMAIVFLFLLFNWAFVPETKRKSWDTMKKELEGQVTRLPPTLPSKSLRGPKPSC